jgi:S-DNA-T family DNA segregation ATPase FtsK/SpoIIIE
MKKDAKKDLRNKDKVKNKKTSSPGFVRSLYENIEDETRQSIWAIVLLVCALYFVLAQFNKAGVAGEYTYKILEGALGVGYFILPLSLLLLGISFITSKTPRGGSSLIVFGGGLFLFSSFGILELLLRGRAGYLGNAAAYPFLNLFGAVAGGIFLFALLLISLLVIFNTRIPELSWDLLKRKPKVVDPLAPAPLPEIKEPEKKDIPQVAPAPLTSFFGKKKDPEDGMFISPGRFKHSGILPPLSLLEQDAGTAAAGDVKANANIIKRTLLNFGIDIEIDDISIGPSITRYAIKPAEGVRLARIVALQNDLSLALAAHPVRIEAPIPGKSLVGIEVPNVKKSTVGLGTLLRSSFFADSKDSLLVALGKNITGSPVFSNIAKAPHLLIAGTTGSGKSVTIHALVTSLLYRNPPQALRFIMIDPKRVELTLYNGIPHLLTPVITNPKKAVLSLKWAITEMERRYTLLEKEGVRDIGAYHALHKNDSIDKDDENREPTAEEKEGVLPGMPYIVIVIDELADIMATYPKELESSVVRLAQMSRAIGIHLVLSTQRPSVNVITGLIKANVPSRIALQVSSQIDSRTILDMAGAEKLLGSGDMLYMSGEMAKPVRLQSAYVTEGEVKKVTAFLKKEHAEELYEEIILPDEGKGNNLMATDLGGDSADDDLYEDAREIVITTKKASATFLQRKLGIGYARAARIIDMLEERNVIGPGAGAKAREVYEIGPQDLVATPTEEPPIV